MSYVRTGGRMGSPGCGSRCRCTSCRLGEYGESWVPGPLDGTFAAPPALGRRWRVGDPHHALTAAGREPIWATIRRRYWQNRAQSARPGEFTPENLARMRRGLAPLDRASGRPVELEHIVPQRTGHPDRHRDLMELTPLEHSFFDRFRRVTDPAGRRFQTHLYDTR